MSGRLHGKSAMITGAARGIGAAFAQVYAAEGATAAFAGSRRPSRLSSKDRGLDILVNNAAHAMSMAAIG